MAATILAWLRLVRLPNHATALADVLAGYLIVSQLRTIDWPVPALCWALLASVAFYAAGMVLNDVFDVELDREQRPERPLPSGRIDLRAAVLAGNLLLTLGSLAACATALAARSPWPALVGAALTAAVWIYDRHAKATPLGPIAMGACRSLNWLLGMTAAGGPRFAAEWLLPIGMGVYVMGITLYARNETEENREDTLTAGSIIMLVGLAMAGLYPWLMARAIPEGGTWLGTGAAGEARLSNWLLLWSVLSAPVLLRCLLGMMEPTAERVQQAVGNAIMSIIALDAALVLATCGEPWAILLCMLVVPFLLGRRIVSPT
jgi:4-hydroxybenzoate polyprenyltransferase